MQENPLWVDPESAGVSDKVGCLGVLNVVINIIVDEVRIKMGKRFGITGDFDVAKGDFFSQDAGKNQWWV